MTLPSIPTPFLYNFDVSATCCTQARPSSECERMERPRGAGNTDRGLTHRTPTRSEGSVEPTAASCSFDQCPKPVIARALCPTHYAAARRAGRFEVRDHPRTPLLERLLKRIDQSGGPDACWPWTGAHNPRGYGLTYRFDGSRRISIGAHKAIYEATKEPVPDGLYVLHSCHNPPCCNPAHLRPGTHLENMADRQEQGETNPSGNWSPRAIHLTDEGIAAIRATYRPRVKGHTIRAVAAQFGIDQAIVWQIVNYRGRWAESA